MVVRMEIKVAMQIEDWKDEVTVNLSKEELEANTDNTWRYVGSVLTDLYREYVAR